MVNRDIGPPAAHPVRGWRIAAYRTTMWIVELSRRFTTLLDSLFEAINLGLLRPGDIDGVVSRSYAEHADFYKPQDYRPPFADEESALAVDLRKRSTGTRLLDAFCGQGREARTFAEVGFDVTGIDRLPAMIDRARVYAESADFEANFIIADFDTFESETRFHVVYTSTWMFSTVQTVDRRRRFLIKCRDLCEPGGLVVISYKIRPTDQRIRYQMRHFIAKAISYLTFGNRSVEIGDRLYYGLFWHHFEEHALDAELSSLGLSPVQRVVASDSGELVFRVLGVGPSITPETAGA